MKRRTFLKNTAAVTAGAIAAPYILKGRPLMGVKPLDKMLDGNDDNIFIIIEMFGGNDGLNTIVPYEDYDRYVELRPTLNIPKSKLHAFGDKLYMSPFIVDNIHNGGMMNLLDDGRLGIIEGVGYENPTLSHFRSQEIHLSGINNSDSSVKLLTGWLGRYFAKKISNFPEDIPDHPLAISIDGTVPLLFKSDLGHMGIALTDPDSFYELGVGLQPEEALMKGDGYYKDEFNFVHTIATQSELYSKAVKQAYDKGIAMVNNVYTDGLPQKLKTISALIAGGLKTKVYHVKLSNFDSHAQQMTADFEGQHPTLLRQVANSICEFLDDAQKQGWADRVVGMTLSEFGRRPYDNGSRGTDHGAASMQFVFGNYVEAGYFGDPPDLQEFDVDGNVKYQHEFRRTFVDFLQTWFGASAQDIEDIFGEPFLPIGVLRPRQTCVESDYLAGTRGMGEVKVYPNPTGGQATIQFELRKAADVKVEIYNIPGFLVQSVRTGQMAAGIKKIPFKMRQSGSYIAAVTIGCMRYVTNFTVTK